MNMSSTIAGSYPNDFPDWLSPLTVKELRQGLRSRSFLITFLVAQAGMVALTTIEAIQHTAYLQATSGISSSAMYDPTLLTALEHTFPGYLKALLFVALVCLLLPVRGWLAMREERVGRAFELFILAGAPAEDLVKCKWRSQVLLALVLSLSLLPYSLCDWFLNGFELPTRACFILWCLFESWLVSAAAIYAATHSLPAQVLVALFSLPVFAFTLFLPLWVMMNPNADSLEFVFRAICMLVVFAFLCPCYVFAAIWRLDQRGSLSPVRSLVESID